jgi:hypothetical protein
MEMALTDGSVPLAVTRPVKQAASTASRLHGKAVKVPCTNKLAILDLIGDVVTVAPLPNSLATFLTPQPIVHRFPYSINYLKIKTLSHEVVTQILDRFGF